MSDNMNSQEEQIVALAKELSHDSLVSWSDEKKKGFCGVLEQRINVSRYINIMTAQEVFEKARNRRYVSYKHQPQDVPANTHDLMDKGVADRYGYIQRANTVGGRSIEDLNKIASERAEAILRELPALKTAVQVIAPDVAKMLDRRDEIIKEGNAVSAELENVTEPLSLSDMDQNMTIAQFRTLVKGREKKRKELINKLNELGDEGHKIEDTVNKKLYSGLPGLSEAVVKVVQDHYERNKALDQMNRRMSEKVMFGDSSAATDILKKFESDEMVIEGSIKVEFAAAMLKLKEAAKSGKGVSKELKAAKSKTK